MTNLDGYDWNAVGYACNQLPGNPEVVAQAATRFRNTANHLNLAARSLRRLDNSSDTCSEAVDKIVGKANEVAGLLDQVYARYATSAGALSAYAPALAHAQQQAEQALRGAAQAKHEYDVAQRNAVQAYDHARASTDPLERQELLQHYYSQKSRAESSASSLDNARAIIAGAIHERDLAAKKAAGQIDDAIHDSQINDGLFDHLKEVWHEVEDLANWVYEHDPLLKTLVDGIAAAAEWIWDHLDVICNVVSIVLTVAAIVCLVTGVGTPIAGLLFAVSRVVGFVGDAKQVFSGVAEGRKTGKWGPFFLAVGITVIDVVAGKVAGPLTRKGLDEVGKGAWRGLARESVKQTGSYRTATNALRMGAITPQYSAARSALAPLTPLSRRTDALLSTFKGSDLNEHAATLGKWAMATQDRDNRLAAEGAVELVLGEGGEKIAKAVAQAGIGPVRSFADGFRQTTQPVPAGPSL